MSRIFATDFWRQQDPVLGTVIPPPVSTFSRSGTAYRHYPISHERRIETVGVDVLRASWQYNPESGMYCRGAQLEEGRTNYALQNCTIDNATWIKTGGSIVQTPIVLPDGVAASYDTLHEDTSIGDHGISQTSGAVPAGVVTFSAYVYSQGQDKLRLAGTSDYVEFDLGTGSVYAASGGVIDADIIDLHTGWLRCWWSTSAQAGTQTISAFAQAAFGATSYAGLGVDSALIWGVQLEDGPFPTSLIVTTTAPVARHADSDYVVAGPLPDAQQGWLSGRLYIPPHTPIAEIPVLTLSDGGAATDRIRLAINTSGNLELQSACSGGDAGLTEAGSVMDGRPEGVSVFATWRPGELALSVDGVFGAVDHTVDIPAELDQLELHPSGCLVGDIQIGDRYRRTPWRHIAALGGSSLQPCSLDSLETDLTINGRTVSPLFLYRGRDATTNALVATVGNDLPKYERGTDVSVSQDIAIPGGVGQACWFHDLGDHYAALSGETAFGTGDFVIEMVFTPGPLIGREKYWLSNYPGGNPFSGWCNANSNAYRLYLNGPVIILFDATPGVVYHLMIFADRDGYLQAYANNITGGVGDISSKDGVSFKNGKLNIGGGGAWTNKTENSKVAWLAAWESPDWLDSHLQPALVEARFNVIFGS